MREKERPASSNAPQGPDSPLAEHVERNLHAVTELHLQAEREVNAHQRAVERATAALGRPAALYVTLAFVVCWVIAIELGRWLGLGYWDPWPYHVLQGLIGLAALVVATMVLITQNRQQKLSERHLHLDLQVNLLTEQKVTKVIDLLEELRTDLPNVRNRRDAEVEALQQPTEPLMVAAALATLEDVREALAEEKAAASEAPAEDPDDVNT
ncbi:MAG: DUF1003 domain-containing protein [Ardenticatenia bacterium]|nr:DUF1003 domain-containing protein [Ardenticatenia bacterium]